MMKGQSYALELLTQPNSRVPMQSGQQELEQQQQQQECTTSSTNVPISPVLVAPARRPPRYNLPQRHLNRNSLMPTTTPTVSAMSKLTTRRHHMQHQTQIQHQQQCNHKHKNSNHHHQLRVIRASEYKNLRQVVPSLRRQRDVGKVEVVTEAARYIDHLHKTLIERFVLCGIPNSLKDILGTDDANELSSQHIMNLVTSMAGKQRMAELNGVSATRSRPTRARAISRNITPTKRALFVPNHNHSHRNSGVESQNAPHQADLDAPADTNTPFRANLNSTSKDGANLVGGHCFRKTLPVVVVKPKDLLEGANQIVADESTKK